MQSYFSKFIPPTTLSKVLFTTAFVVSTGLFQAIDIWNTHFNHHTWLYFLYSLLKITTLAFLAIACHSAGKILLSQECIAFLPRRFSSIDVLLFRLFSGSCFIGIIYFIAGYFNAYYYITALVITAPLIYKSYDGIASITSKLYTNSILNFSFKYIYLLNVPIVILTIISLTDAYIRGANTPTLTADVDIPNHYLNYYSQALYRFNGWWPTNHLLGFYYLKGSGLYFLGMSLTDPHGASLVGYLFFCFTLLLFYRTLSFYLPSNTTILFGGFLFTLSRFNHIVTYYKLHIMINSMALFAIYSSLVLLHLNIFSKRLNLALICFGVGFSICYPTMAIFASIFVSIALLFSFFTSKLEALKSLSYLVVSLLVSSTAIFIINYKMTGVFDYSMRAFDSFWNLDVFSSWMDPANLMIQLGLDYTDGKFNSLMSITNFQNGIQRFFQDIIVFSSPYSFHSLISSSIITTIIVINFFSIIFPDVFCLNSSQRTTIKFILICSFIYFIVLASINHMALNRAFLASSFLCILLLTSSLALVSSLIAHHFHFQHSYIIFISIIAALFTPQISNDIRPADWPFYSKAFIGKFTLLDSSEYNYPTRFYYDLQNALPSDSKALLLTSQNGALTIPKSIYQLGYSSDLRNLTTQILFGKPHNAVNALRMNNIRYAVIDIRKPLMYISLAPIFHPDFFFKHWKLFLKNDHFYVFELSPDISNDSDFIFLSTYRSMLMDIDKSHIRAYDKAHSIIHSKDYF